MVSLISDSETPSACAFLIDIQLELWRVFEPAPGVRAPLDQMLRQTIPAADYVRFR